jgi:hypothetical protein
MFANLQVLSAKQLLDKQSLLSNEQKPDGQIKPTKS